MAEQALERQYPTLAELQARRTQERYERAVEAARNVLDWLAAQGVEAGVFGSLVQGRFKAHSDVDFLIFSCPEQLRYRLESGVEDRMKGLPFDVIYLDELREPLKQSVLQEVVHASDFR